MEQDATPQNAVVMLPNIGWDFLRQRHQVFATHFARTGHQVIFVEGLGYSPNYLDPHFYIRAAKKLWRKARHARSKNVKRGLPVNLTVYPSIVAPPRPRILRYVNKKIF